MGATTRATLIVKINQIQAGCSQSTREVEEVTDPDAASPLEAPGVSAAHGDKLASTDFVGWMASFLLGVVFIFLSVWKMWLVMWSLLNEDIKKYCFETIKKMIVKCVNERKLCIDQVNPKFHDLVVSIHSPLIGRHPRSCYKIR